MCGLVAVIAPAGVTIDSVQFDSAVSSLRHRGPDAANVEHCPEQGVALGHTRLSIVDPQPRSDQPFHTERVTLVFNGEIYNYKELRAELVASGVNFVSSGDTEVIARGFERWGVALFERLEGMYAIVLLDRASGDVFVTRDLFGIKPLYMQRAANGSISFASEVKALRSARTRELHEDTLFDMLTWGFQISHQSSYEETIHFPPGAVLRISRNTDGSLVTILTDSHRLRATFENRHHNGTNLRRVLDHAVRDHLIADVPVAIALSGGLDSSIVAALAAQQSHHLTAFTLTLAEGEDEEVQHAAQVCRKAGLAHRVVRMEVTDFEAFLGKIAYHLEEPIANINVMLTYGLAAAVRQAGFKAILMGEGGDEVFAGYPWYGLCRDPAMRNNPEAIFEAYRKRRSQRRFEQILTRDAQARLAQREKDQAEIFVDHWRTMTTSCLSRFLYFDQTYQLQFSQLLRVDRMTMAHGVEARVPFLYERIARLSATLKDSEKSRLHWYQRFGRDGKIALAKAAGRLLPRAVRHRPKFGARGTVNLWESNLVRQLPETFESMVRAPRYATARERLAHIVAWNGLDADKLPPKRKFALMLMLMCTHIHICGLDTPDRQPFVLHAVS
jgi:asparagine synthase (glutamine-hydrolysing)